VPPAVIGKPSPAFSSNPKLPATNIPEILGRTEWRPWPYIARLLYEATPIEKEEFDALFAEWKKDGWTTAENEDC
jgi:hypothetical protein